MKLSSAIVFSLLIFELSAGAVRAATASYTSLANQLTIDNNSRVSLSLVEINNDEHGDEARPCIGEGQSIFFDLVNEQLGTSKWLDTIILSRNSRETLSFEYDEQDCALVAISYPQLVKPGDPVNTDGNGAKLDGTGLNGNVALIGSNGITADDISASTHHGNDTADAAFDGYDYFNQLNDDSEGKISRGIWLANLLDDDKKLAKPWIQIDFGAQVDIASIGLMVNSKSVELGRSAKGVNIMAATDADSFYSIQENQLTRTESNLIKLDSPIRARYFRLEFSGNYGDKNYIEVDEIEFYQP